MKQFKLLFLVIFLLNTLFSVVLAQEDDCTPTQYDNPQTICPGESYTIGSSVYTSAGEYFDLFENQYGCDSIIKTIISYPAPTNIFVQPKSQSVHESSEVSFFVGAEGYNISYQWKQDGIAIPQENSSILTRSSQDEGVYTVDVLSACMPTVTSAGAALTTTYGTTDGLVFHIPFDGSATEVISNYASSGSYIYFGYKNRFNVSNKSGTSFYSGSGKNLEFSDVTELPRRSEPYTFSAWIYSGGNWDSTKNNYLFSWGDSKALKGGYVQLTSNYTLRVAWNNSVILDAPITGIGGFEWIHVVTSWDGDELKTYINNNLLASRKVSNADSLLNVTAKKLIIGRLFQNANTGYIGSLDDFKVYNKALSEEEINELFHYNAYGSTYSVSISSPTNLCENSSFVPKVTVLGNGLKSYQWFLNGVPLSDNQNIEGAQSEQLRIHQITKELEGNYSLLVFYNNGYSRISNTASITVNSSSFEFSNYPQASLLCPGSNVELSLSESALATSYQWYKNNELIANAKSKTFAINNLQSAHEGNYILAATLACGVYNSEEIKVSVNHKIATNNLEIIGSSFHCEGEDVVFSLPEFSQADSYIWTLPQGWLGNSTSHTITATVGATGGTIQAKIF